MEHPQDMANATPRQELAIDDTELPLPVCMHLFYPRDIAY